MASRGTVEVTLPGGAIGTQIITQGARLARKHYVVSLTWLLGLLLCLLGNGYQPRAKDVQMYQDTLDQLPTKELMDSRAKAFQLEQVYRHSKGWFFSCDDVCTENYHRYKTAERQYNAMERSYMDGVKDAKSAVGLFSSYGTEEVRNVFWSTFTHGKAYAKRATMWDALWYGVGSMGRDEGILEYALRVVISLLMNFTFGLLMAFIGFVSNLWGVISSYRPDFITGLLFFALATIAAASFLVTWLLALLAGTAGGVYVVTRVAVGNAVENARRQQEREYYLRGSGMGGPGASDRRTHVD